MGGCHGSNVSYMQSKHNYKNQNRLLSLSRGESLNQTNLIKIGQKSIHLNQVYISLILLNILLLCIRVHKYSY